MGEGINEDEISVLSSDTRRELLKELKRGEKTPSYLANQVDRHKSTVSEHLSKLEDSGFVEKHDPEGKRRVTYSLTRKGEKTVSSDIPLVIGSVTSLVIGSIVSVAASAQSSLSSFSSTESMQAGKALNETVNKSSKVPSQPAIEVDPLLAAGLILLFIGFSGLGYWLYRRFKYSSISPNNGVQKNG